MQRAKGSLEEHCTLLQRGSGRSLELKCILDAKKSSEDALLYSGQYWPLDVHPQVLT